MKNIFAKFAIIAISAISLALTAPAETEFDNEFWISTSTNTSNLGTLDNPFDGSTATKFDTVMSSRPPNCTIHILAGTYMTDGGHGFILKSGQKIRGSGMDVTILKLIPTATTTDIVLVDSSTAGLGAINTNIEISDLTCDCNYQSGEEVTFDGITLGGTNEIVDRVRVVHVPCFDTNDLEAFGINVSGGYGDVIENSEVSQSAGGTYLTAMVMNGGAGVMCHNRVVLSPSFDSDAFNGGAYNGVLIEGNYVDGASVGVYNDTGDITNLIIADNVFKNVRSGVDFDGDGDCIRHNITISDNTIMLTTNNVGSGSGVYGISISPYDTNLTIIGNTVGWINTPNPDEIGFAYFLNVGQGEEGIVVANNRVDSDLWNGDYGTNGITPWNGYVAYNNYDFQGNLLTNLDQGVPFADSFYVLPPDGFVQVWGGPSVNVGLLTSLSSQGYYGWNFENNTSATLFKALPNDFWGGKSTFVTSWNIMTTNSGNYIFYGGVCDVLTNGFSNAAQEEISFTSPSGTNITTVSTTNTLPGGNVPFLETYIYTGAQTQPYNYSILNGKVTAE